MKRTIKTYVALEADDEDDDLVLYWDLYTCTADIPELARKDAPGEFANSSMVESIDYIWQVYRPTERSRSISEVSAKRT